MISKSNKEYENKQKVAIKKYEKLLKLQRLFYTQFNQLYTKEIIALMTHQLRQPLNTISLAMSNMYLNAQMNALEKEEIEKTTKLIQTQCMNVSEMIDNFFPFDSSYKKIKISKIIKNINKMLSTQLYNRKINFNIDIEDDFNIDGDISLFNSTFIGIIFYLRDELRKSDKKNLSIAIKNNSITITASIIPNLKNIFSSNTKDAKMLISRSILTQEFGMEFKIKLTDKIKITLKKKHV